MTDNTLPIVVTPKPWYTSRTLWVNAASVLLAVLMFSQEQLGLGILPVAGDTKTWLMFGLGVANLALRLVTTQPIAAPR